MPQGRVARLRRVLSTSTTLIACALISSCVHAMEIRPGTGFGRFQAAFEDGVLHATLKVHFIFERGQVHLAPGFHPDEYRWTDDTRQAFADEFKAQAHETWSGQYRLISPDGSQRVPVDLRVVETRHRDDADWVIYAYHYPDDAPHVEASVCDVKYRHYPTSTAPCLPNVDGLDWGTLSIARHHRLADAVSPAEYEPTYIYFGTGEHTVDWRDESVPVMMRGTEALDLVVDGTQSKGWWISLVGAAGGNEPAAGGTPDHEEPSIALARKRLDTVQDYLIAQGVPAEQFHRVAVGQFSDEGAGADALTGWVKVSIQPYSFKTIPHEVGHMLGLPDESSLSRETN